MSAIKKTKHSTLQSINKQGFSEWLICAQFCARIEDITFVVNSKALKPWESIWEFRWWIMYTWEVSMSTYSYFYSKHQCSDHTNTLSQNSYTCNPEFLLIDQWTVVGSMDNPSLKVPMPTQTFKGFPNVYLNWWHENILKKKQI